MKKTKFTCKLKKITISLFAVLCILIIIPMSYVIYQGYDGYIQAIKNHPLEEYINNIRNQEDYVKIENINEDLIKATVAIEDRRFYNHNGIDLIGIGRAAISIVITKEIVSGGSTITQQLAKNMYFPLDLTLERKVSEAFMARQIEKKYSKNDILELYLNIINYGDNYMGIKNASQGYFQKQPGDLTLNEATLLAGLPQSPSYYQLSNHFDEAKNRQLQVLNAMSKENLITQVQIDAITNYN